MQVTTTIAFNEAATNALPVPGGGCVGDLTTAELARRLVKAGVPNVDYSMGKQALGSAYASFVAKGRGDAGDAWHKAWVDQHGGAN